MAGQLTREEINFSSKDENRPLEIKVNQISGQSEKIKSMSLSKDKINLTGLCGFKPLTIKRFSNCKTSLLQKTQSHQ